MSCIRLDCFYSSFFLCYRYNLGESIPRFLHFIFSNGFLGINRVHERPIGNSLQKITKQIVGENRCDDINFRPLSGYCQKMKGRGNKNEFFPKRGFYVSFGKNSNSNILQIKRQLGRRNQRPVNRSSSTTD